MRTRRVRKICFVMLIVLFCVCTSWYPVHAATSKTEEVMPLSIDAAKNVTLSISSAGKATATCRVSGESGEVDKIVINMYLQKKNSNGYWDTYQRWYATKSSYYHNLTKSCTVTSGTYRLYVRVICYNGSDAETTYLTTASKTYR